MHTLHVRAGGGRQVACRIFPIVPIYLEGNRSHSILAFRGRALFRVTSLIRKRHPAGPFSRTLPRALWGSQGGGRFLTSEVPLY